MMLEIAGSLDGPTVISRVLRRSLESFAADRATLSRVLDDGSIRIEASVSASAPEVNWTGGRYADEMVGRYPEVRRCLDTAEIVLAGQLDPDRAPDELKEGLARARVTALMPIRTGGTVTGMLVLSRFDSAPYTEADIPRLSALATLAGLALSNARLYERLATSSRQIDLAIGAAGDLAAAADLPSLLPRLAEQAAQAISADGCTIAHEHDGMLVMDASWGECPDRDLPLSPEASTLIRGSRPRVIDLTEGPTLLRGIDPAALAWRYVLVTPLILTGRMLGILILRRRDGRTSFDATDERAVTQFAGLAALIINNARLLDDIRSAEHNKRELVDIAVHEMRSPLTVIDGYSSMLLEGSLGDLSPMALRAVSTISTKAAEARALANSLLTVARIESSELKVDRTPLDVAAAAGRAAERARPQAELRDGSINVAAEGPVIAVGDANLVASILDNLISNAIAYSIEAPTIAICVEERDRWADVTVTDRGPGIDVSDRPHIFERFYRGTARHGGSGSGLGLYVSVECARQMGGDLTLLDTGPGGSSFRLSLPTPS